MKVEYTPEELRILTTPIGELNDDDREVLKKLLRAQGVDIIIMDR